jgi:lycopene cyclase domain-containing protein
VSHWSYLAVLLAGLACMGLMDRRWRLVLWADLRRGLTVLSVGVVGFLVWDLLAVHAGFYRRGGAGIVTGVQVAPGVPLEEVFFVLFLCYVTLVLHRLATGVLLARSQPAGSGDREPPR